MARPTANIDDRLWRRMKVKLAREGLTFMGWLRRAIEEYLR